jgi:hypothetical protein
MHLEYFRFLFLLLAGRTYLNPKKPLHKMVAAGTEPKTPAVQDHDPQPLEVLVNKKKESAMDRCYSGDQEDLVYKSGIATLRSSSHRVKFAIKNRKQDPKPRDRDGNETETTWLPTDLLSEVIFQYDMNKYNLTGAIISLLQSCDPEIVGSFEETGEALRLEDFRLPIPSLCRKVHGGQCENAQRYLSDMVASNSTFMEVFDRFVTEVALPYTKQRLVACGAVDEASPLTFYYQRPSTMRLQPGPGWAKVKPHNDAEYGHQNGELNFWIPLTDRSLTGVDMWSETSFKADDYSPMPAEIGEAISFHGSSCRHYVNANSSNNTRVSLDFRVGVQGFYDPFWTMKGTTDDHDRREVTL